MDVRRGRARNTEIDRLSGVPENQRTLADVVSDKVFADLEARLDSATSDLILVTNKLVAHASTLESREHDKTNDVESTRVTIKDLWNALECLCRSVAGLDGWLINRTSHTFLPDMRNHHWNGIDFPLVETHNIPKLMDYWKHLEEEASDWGIPAKAL
jgi:hypothetical protein